MKILYILSLFVFASLAFSAFAEEIAPISPPPPVVGEPDGTEETDGDSKAPTYLPMTIRNLSQLYWGLSALDINNDDYVDNFLRINECDLYKEYINNEFDWIGIRNAGKDKILKNKTSFPLRFEIVQPLQLTEYDLQRKGFHIAKEFQILGARRFEVMATDYQKEVCGSATEIYGYPKGLMVEFNRPVTFDFLPLSEELAKLYLEEKQKYIDIKKIKNKADGYAIRNAYIVMKVKFFAAVGDSKAPNINIMLRNIMAVLESMEIYADMERKQLLYSENYQTRKKASATEDRLRREHEIRRRMQQEAEKKRAKEKEAKAAQDAESPEPANATEPAAAPSEENGNTEAE